jgi:hypothetical protein
MRHFLKQDKGQLLAVKVNALKIRRSIKEKEQRLVD